MTKLLHAGEHKIQEFKDNKKKQAEDEETKKEEMNGVSTKKRSDVDKKEFYDFLNGIAN